MSIQPNRVVARIIHQVDQSDWSHLDSQVFSAAEGDVWLRVFRVPADPCYATPIHFWVHALRDELAATGRRVDLVGAAGHALCRKTPVEDWLSSTRRASAAFGEETEPVLAEVLDAVDAGARADAYLMLESPCRRSSVVEVDAWLVADFWSHGAGPSWRVRG